MESLSQLERPRAWPGRKQSRSLEPGRSLRSCRHSFGCTKTILRWRRYLLWCTEQRRHWRSGQNPGLPRRSGDEKKQKTCKTPTVWVLVRLHRSPVLADDRHHARQHGIFLDEVVMQGRAHVSDDGRKHGVIEHHVCGFQCLPEVGI